MVFFQNMENRNVGYLIFGISIILVVIVLIFNSALEEVVNQSCSMAGHESCIMHQTINQQTYLALSIVGLLVLFGLFLFFSKPNEKIIVKSLERKKKRKYYDLSYLKKDERKVFEIVKTSSAVFQADLIEKLGIGKARMSRILDRLEGNGFIERKRRGMTNIVVLKE